MTKISDISNFPYKSFGELQEAVKTQKIGIHVNQIMSSELMACGKIGSLFWRFIYYFLLLFSPIIVFMVTTIIPIYMGKPLLILILIPLFLSFYFLKPNSPFREQVNIIYYIMLVLFFVGLLMGKPILTFLVAPFLAIWIMLQLLYKLSVSQMKRAVLKDEELFCLLYKNRVILLFNSSGDMFMTEYSNPDYS